MKKQNRNVFAYVRQPNLHSQEESLLGTSDKLGKSANSPTMYNQIVGQMNHQFSSYVSNLVNKNQKQQEKRKTMQKSLNHQRTKSYADILIATPSGTKTPAQKGHSHRGSHPSAQVNNIFFSLSSTPTNQKPTEINKQTKKQRIEKSNQFLDGLDQYIADLSTIKESIHSGNDALAQTQQFQRRTVQKSRENSSSNLRLVQKFQNVLKRQKQLKVANTILETENAKLLNKLKKQKAAYSRTCNQLMHEANALLAQNKQIKKQKRKLEEFFQQIQSKCYILRPQRKTSGARPHRNQQYLLSQTTEQDDTQLIAQYPAQLRRETLKRKAVPKTTGKQSRLSGFHVEQLSAYLAARNNYDIEDEDQSGLYDP